MNNTWLKIILIFSLAINGAVLVAVGYPFARQYWGNQTKPFVQQDLPFKDVPPQVLQSRLEFRNRLRQERMRVRNEQSQLAELLMAEPPDIQKIKDKIQSIANLQGKIQQAVVDQILKETAAMTPEQRRLYLSNIQGRMCQGPCGKGPRFGGRGGRRNMPWP
jgi:hypothetical protein